MVMQTAAALGWVSVAAACYPEAQTRVQAQLDEVVGRDRRQCTEVFLLMSALTLHVQFPHLKIARCYLR